MPHEGMVHALEEIWRVLARQGVLVDIRPMVTAAPIHVCAGDEELFVDSIDQNRGRPDDAACELALERVEAMGLFRRGRSMRVPIRLYWDSAAQMAKDIEENWTRRGRPLEPPQTARAEAALREAGPHAKLRSSIDVKFEEITRIA